MVGVSPHRPRFIPWTKLIATIAASDVYVAYDSVHFTCSARRPATWTAPPGRSGRPSRPMRRQHRPTHPAHLCGRRRRPPHQHPGNRSQVHRSDQGRCSRHRGPQPGIRASSLSPAIRAVRADPGVLDLPSRRRLIRPPAARDTPRSGRHRAQRAAVPTPIAAGFARRVGLTQTPEDRAVHAFGRTRRHSAASTIRMSGKPRPSSR